MTTNDHIALFLVDVTDPFFAIHQILVMQEGKAAEFGTPSDLIDDGGVFAGLVNATGEGAAALIAMAREKQEQKKRSSVFDDG